MAEGFTAEVSMVAVLATVAEVMGGRVEGQIVRLRFVSVLTGPKSA